MGTRCIDIDAVGTMQQTFRIPSLDGWRALAITLVLIAHFGPKGSRWCDVGTQGVGIFFVLSGYLITTNLRREWETAGRLDLRSFYIRRCFRIMPAAWLYLLALLPFGLMSFRELAGCVFFFRNFLSHTPTRITVHFWSLSIEEQFYLFWPLLLSVMGPPRARIAAIVAAIGFAAFRSLCPWVLSVPNWTPFHADALLVGCFFALASVPKMRAWLFWPCTLLLAFCVHAFPLIPPFAESMMVGWMIHTTSQGGYACLDWKPLAQIGFMSYSIYLWHGPFTAIPHGTPLGMGIALISVAAASAFSFYYVERPCRRLGYRIAASRRLALPSMPGVLAAGDDLH